jgi:hypothetical protein
MSSTVLEVILKIVALVYADVSPELKAAALAELQKIAATEAGHPLLSFAITAAVVGFIFFTTLWQVQRLRAALGHLQILSRYLYDINFQ